jgi:hypothetical protein
MAKTSMVSPTPSSSLSKINDASLNDLASLRVKEEIIVFDEYVSSVQGVHKLHFESLMNQSLLENQALTTIAQKVLVIENPG